MRAIVDLINSLTNGLRMIIGMIALVLLMSVIVISFTASRVATNASENFANKAETLGERAIEAKITADREKALAEDGWGYGSGSASGSDDWNRDR